MELDQVKEIKQKLRSNQIYYGDSFFIAYSQYMQADPIKAHGVQRTPSNIINEKKYTIKDTDATYRTINHWAKLGLIDDDRESEGKGWRKFSVVDLVWLCVLKELREYGFSLEKIKKGYDAINDMPGLLEFGIYLAMSKQAVYLIVLPDGYIELATRSSLLASESTGLLKESSYLVINLNNCLMSFLPDVDYRPKSDTFTLSKKEVSVLSELRFGGCDEISVQMRNGDIHRVDSKSKNVGEIGKLSDIFNAVYNGEFTIKKQDGKITFIEKVTKNKV